MQKETHKNKKYSVETRIQAVEAYLREEGSQREICKEFEIKDVHTLRKNSFEKSERICDQYRCLFFSSPATYILYCLP